METYLIFTYIPRRHPPGMLFARPEAITVDESQRENLDDLLPRLHIPADGYCIVVNKKDATKVVAEKNYKIVDT